ncbi:MAG: exodeoxyribonuclease VII large subunit, partial [Clostridia bacterium]
MPDNRRIATVTQLNNFIKALLEQTPVLKNVWIKGEISNLKFHSSGHIYLTLKDEGSVLRAVMFRTAAAGLTFRPENGMKVLAGGRVAVYERDGGYQLYIENMEAEGQGDLYVRFEQLKKQLGAEGLFDPARKRPIPKFPRTVGICTSPTG